MRDLLACLTVLTLLVLTGRPALAQPCSSDSQCNMGYPSQAQCLGDMLIVKRSICAFGQCRSEEVRRESCRGVERSGCIAGAFEYTSSRCDASLARCVTRTDRDLCLPGCSCRNKVLRVSTGQCLAAIGCTRHTLKCEHGCTCSPEPRCLDEPVSREKLPKSEKGPKKAT